MVILNWDLELMRGKLTSQFLSPEPRFQISNSEPGTGDLTYYVLGPGYPAK